RSDRPGLGTESTAPDRNEQRLGRAFSRVPPYRRGAVPEAARRDGSHHAGTGPEHPRLGQGDRRSAAGPEPAAHGRETDAASAGEGGRGSAAADAGAEGGAGGVLAASRGVGGLLGVGGWPRPVR